MMRRGDRVMQRRRAGLVLAGLGRAVGLAVAAASGGWSAAFAQPAVNLAEYQNVLADSAVGASAASLAVDGVVSNLHAWQSATASGQHWLEVRFPAAVDIGSMQLFLGRDGAGVNGSFQVQTSLSGAWVTVPGGAVTGNTQTERAFVFAAPVRANRVRFITSESFAVVRELAVYSAASPVGAMGEGLRLNQGGLRRVAASSTFDAGAGAMPRYPFPAMAALDGRADDDSAWLSGTAGGTHTLEVDLPAVTRLGGVHVYTGLAGQAGTAAPAFLLERWTGSTWAAIPGASVTNNTGGNERREISLAFTTPIDADRVRLSLTAPGAVRVREVVLHAWNPAGVPPLGAGVESGGEAYPATFNEFGDAFYGLVNAGSGQAIEFDRLEPESTRKRQQVQVLLNLGRGSVRLVNRVSGRALEVAGASREDGAAVVEGSYTATAHQQWRLERVSGVRHRIVNRYTGLALADDGAGGLCQRPVSGDASRLWDIERRTHYPKKGVADWEAFVTPLGGAWAYNWSINDGQIPATVDFLPMKWGNFTWDEHPSRVSGWQRRAAAVHFLGFNEPDLAEQSNISVATALDLAPRLEDADLPIASPVTTYALNTWMTQYMDEADRRGIRHDVVPAHIYLGPFADSLLGYLAETHARYRRPIWLTEFATFDFGNSGSWDQDDNYNFYAEVLWRMERLEGLGRYSVFVFRGNSATTGEMVFNDNTLTPSGRLYAAWDGDTTLRTDTPYFIHNRQTHERLGSAGETQAAPVLGNRFSEGDSHRFMMVQGPAAGRVYLQCVATGQRLRNTAGTVDLAPAGTAGTAVEWAVGEHQHGWFLITHTATNTRLSRTTAGAWQMASGTFADPRAQWRLVRPLGATLGPVSGLFASRQPGAVTLAWRAHGHPSVETYRVLRSATGPAAGGEVVASGLTSTSWTDALPAGVSGTFRYAVVAVTEDGVDAATSNEAVVSLCGADFDGNGAAQPADAQAFVAAVAAGDAVADVAPPAGVDFFDVLEFLRVLDLGCAVP